MGAFSFFFVFSGKPATSNIAERTKEQPGQFPADSSFRIGEPDCYCWHQCTIKGGRYRHHDPVLVMTQKKGKASKEALPFLFLIQQKGTLENQ
jgi:hypothetical protein